MAKGIYRNNDHDAVSVAIHSSVWQKNFVLRRGEDEPIDMPDGEEYLYA